MAAGSVAAQVGHHSAQRNSFNRWLIMSSLTKFCGWDEKGLVVLMLCYVFCWTQHEQQRTGTSHQPGVPFPKAGVRQAPLIVSR